MKLNVPITGFLIGLLLPFIGLVVMYFIWGSHQGLYEFVRSLTYQPGMASKVMTLSLLINLIPFVYFNFKRIDYAMRGVVIATMLYALLIILVKFVW